MPVWVILGLLAAVVLAVAAYQEFRPRRELRRPSYASAAPAVETRALPGSLLSPREAEFFRLLRQAAAGRYVPLAKVQLLALAPGLAAAPGAEESLYRSADFLLLDGESLQPVLVLQLDVDRGRSVYPPGTAGLPVRRDGLVAALLGRAGLTVIEVSGGVEWTAPSLAALIADAMAGRHRA